MPAITKGPRPVYHLMGKQNDNNVCPGLWTELDSSAHNEYIIGRLEELYDSPALALYYDELAIFMGMGSILMPQGRGTDEL